MPIVQSLASISPAELRPYDGNPRRHTRAQIKKLAGLIKRYGFTSAIAVDEDRVVLAGHGRLEAAMLLGLKQVPVVLVEGLSEAEKIALRIADNRVADESKFDPKLLSVELRSLLEFDLELEATGFDAIELDPILRIGEEEAGEPEPPLPAIPNKPISKPAIYGNSATTGCFVQMHATHVLTNSCSAVIWPPWCSRIRPGTSRSMDM